MSPLGRRLAAIERAAPSATDLTPPVVFYAPGGADAAEAEARLRWPKATAIFLLPIKGSVSG